jgi:inorganic pyrophosphatase
MQRSRNGGIAERRRGVAGGPRQSDHDGMARSRDADVTGDGAVDVIVETPAGSHNKLKFDPGHGAFRLSRVLPAGMAFPFDFGFLPGTVAEDGDPLDVLLLLDAPVPTGCLVEARLIGVIEAEQREKDGAVVRNDRLIGVAVESTTRHRLRDVADLDPALLGEIEAFFVQYNRLEGKEFHVLHRRGPGAAAKLARRGGRGAPERDGRPA